MHGIEITLGGVLWHWKRVLECHHQELLRMYSLTNGLDLAYVHGEHGNATHFSISASLAGLVAMREMLGGTRHGKNDGTIKLDICLISPSSIDLIEGKYIEFDISKKNHRERIARGISEATTQILGFEGSSPIFASKDKIIRKIAICYVAPFFNKTPFEEVKVANLLTYIRDELQPDALSWSFPPETRNFKYWNREHPGVIVIAKIITDGPHHSICGA